MTRRVVAVALLPLLVVLAACSGLSGTDDVNYRTDGAGIAQIDPADREGPVDIAGTTLDGEQLDLADLRGGVVVLNIWGSWCNPCRDEAPTLKLASEQLDAEFVGLSFRETSADNARSFEREFGIEYPTITDEDEVLGLGRFVPQSPPSTYVLDAQGRVAAVITGAITSAGTLEDIVTEVADEEADEGAAGE